MGSSDQRDREYTCASVPHYFKNERKNEQIHKRPVDICCILKLITISILPAPALTMPNNLRFPCIMLDWCVVTLMHVTNSLSNYNITVKHYLSSFIWWDVEVFLFVTQKLWNTWAGRGNSRFNPLGTTKI